MYRRLPLAAAITAFAAAPSLAAGPLTVTTRLLAEQRIAAPDGTTRTRLVTPEKAVPGDRITVVLAYRNTGSQPIADLVLANPVPRDLSYRAAVAGTPAPEVSVDGTHFAPLAALRVATPGGPRAAVPADVTHVRWRLSTPVTAGSAGELAFQAVVK